MCVNSVSCPNLSRTLVTHYFDGSTWYQCTNSTSRLIVTNPWTQLLIHSHKSTNQSTGARYQCRNWSEAPPLNLPYLNQRKVSLSLTHPLSLSHSNALSLSFALFLSLSHTHPHSLPLWLSLSPFLYPSLPLAPSLSVSLSLSLSLAFSPSHLHPTHTLSLSLWPCFTSSQSRPLSSLSFTLYISLSLSHSRPPFLSFPPSLSCSHLLSLPLSVCLFQSSSLSATLSLALSICCALSLTHTHALFHIDMYTHALQAAAVMCGDVWWCVVMCRNTGCVLYIDYVQAKTYNGMRASV